MRPWRCWTMSCSPSTTATPLTPEVAGDSVLRLLTEEGLGASREYLLTGEGLRPLP